MGWWKMDADVAKRTDLTLAAKLVHAYLLDRQGVNDKAWPSHQTIAEACGMSRSAAQRAVKLLVKTGLVSTETRTGQSCFYFATCVKMKQVDEPEPASKRRTPCVKKKQVPASKRRTIQKEIQTQDTDNTPCSPPLGDDHAERIYRAYPRHTARQAALKAIRKALKTVPAERLLAVTEAYAAAVGRWPNSERKYIPYPATWFNRGSYDDDPSEWERTNKHGQSLADLSEYGRVDIEA